MTAFGSYNNLVREASYVRGQTVVIWDFECVFSHHYNTTKAQC